MLTIFEKSNQNAFCDGINRRNFIRLGTAGIGAVAGQSIGMDKLLSEDKSARTTSLIIVYLPGGPTQHETFDPKPFAQNEIRGHFNPISTSVSGIQFCELLPKLANNFEKFSIVRTLTGMKNRHESFQCYTGRPGGRNEDSEPSGGWPTIGSVVSKLSVSRQSSVPVYVDASPKMSYQPYVNKGIHDASAKISWPGFTGREHTPFSLAGEVRQDLVLNGVDLNRLEQRESLLWSLGKVQRDIDDLSLSEFQKQAFGTLTSNQLADALDLSKESTKVRELYGKAQKTDPSFGGAPQSPEHLLIARRLVEAGVRCVTVAFGAWDWHANREGPIHQLSSKYLPVFDHAMATLLDDLDERGMLETTTVVAFGEFGRTPRINAKGGRDHWPNTQSVLVAGGGIKGGRVIGETDKEGGRPIDRPVHVQELFATMYKNLGIDVNSVKLTDFTGRPRYLVENNRQPVAELY